MDIHVEWSNTRNSHLFEEKLNFCQKTSHAQGIMKEQSWLQEKWSIKEDIKSRQEMSQYGLFYPDHQALGIGSRAWSGCRGLLFQFSAVVFSVDTLEKVLQSHKQGDLCMSSKAKRKSFQSWMECGFFFWKGKLMYTHEYTMPSINILLSVWWYRGVLLLNYLSFQQWAKTPMYVRFAEWFFCLFFM